MNLGQKRRILLFIVSLLILLGAWFFLSGWYQNVLINDYKKRSQIELNSYSTALSTLVNKRFTLLDSLLAFVSINSDDKELTQKFTTYSSGLYLGKPDIRALQIFPKKLPELVYPEKRNAAVVGRCLQNLLNDERPNVRYDVQRTIQTKKMARSKPYKLRQGGLGLVARKAIYKHDHFWGMVTIVLDVPPLLTISGFPEIINMFKIQIEDRSGTIFWSANKSDFTDPISLPVNIADGNWSLHAEPVGGWKTGIQNQLVVFRILAGIIPILLLSLGIFLFGRQGYLERQVLQRTISLQKSESEIKQLSMELGNFVSHLHKIIEKERKSIALNIHDDLGQTMSALSMDINWLKRKIVQGDKQNVCQDKLELMGKMVLEGGVKIKRICRDLRPEPLDDLGLEMALKWLIKDFQSRGNTDYKFIYELGNKNLNSDYSTAIYRIVQEALNNISRHSKAECAKIQISKIFDTIQLSITDDGIGIGDMNAQRKISSFGLIGMRERTLSLNGTFKLTSHKGDGTTIYIELKIPNDRSLDSSTAINA